jgi:hypothetical protein
MGKIYGSQYDYYLPYIFVGNVVIFLLSVAAIILSGIAFHQSNDRNTEYITNNITNNITNDIVNTTIVDFEWIEYNYTTNMVYNGTSYPFNAKFVTDNTTIAYFFYDYWGVDCGSGDGLTIQTTTSLPTYLIPSVNGTAVDVGGIPIVNIIEDVSCVGGLTITSTGRMRFESNVIDNSITWDGTPGTTCAISSYSGSYLLNVEF